MWQSSSVGPTELGTFGIFAVAPGVSINSAKADGFDPEGKQLYIDPDECIDCGACEPECPVEAIFEESELPEEWSKYTEINAKWFS